MSDHDIPNKLSLQVQLRSHANISNRSLRRCIGNDEFRALESWVDVDSEMKADDRRDKQKRIHHTMWPDYYYPNMSELEREDLKFHNGELPI